MSKTLTKENKSIYLFDDNETVVMLEDKVIIGDPEKLIIGDCNSNNTVLHEGVTAPDDWAGHKYFFDGTNWTLNPDWVDPTTLEETPVV